jgi:ribonucleoside-triphosphate reductase
MGLYPYTKRYLAAKYSNHFSTSGLIGGNEMCRNFFKNTEGVDKGIETPEGQKLCEELLDFLRNKCVAYQEQYPDALFNLEATPGESTCYRLALHDKLKFSDILTAGTIDSPYYTNSTNLPVGMTNDPWEAIEHQENLQTRYTGGVVFHCFADNNSPEPERVRDFVKKVMYNTKIPYLTCSPTLKVCNKGHGMFINDGTNVCPECKRLAIEQYTKTKDELEMKKSQILKELCDC